jgi:hypothetical protein
MAKETSIFEMFEPPSDAAEVSVCYVAPPPEEGEAAAPEGLIWTPDDMTESSEMSGYVFGFPMQEYTEQFDKEELEKFAIGEGVYPYVQQAREVAAAAEGAPVVRTNYIEIETTMHSDAGSGTESIDAVFGTEDSKWVRLLGRTSGTPFPRANIMQWDLTVDPYRQHVEQIPTDAWDEISLRNWSGDGINIGRIKIVHSGVTILNWTQDLWLDGDETDPRNTIGLAAPILSTKLAAVNNSWLPQIHWAARELGKTDGKKYGSTGAWCSEFTAWCLRKELWNFPTGEIGSQRMEDGFANVGRMYTISQVLNGNYVLSEGDYLRMVFSGDHHSGLFIRYKHGPPSTPAQNTEIITIEGNTGARVAVRERVLGDLVSVGSTF